MEKGFFKNLFDATGEIDISIVASKKKNSESMTILVTAKKGDVKLPSLSVSGTPEEIEQQFFSVIIPALGETKSVAINIDNYRSQLKKIEEEEKSKVTSKKAKASDKTSKDIVAEEYKELTGEDVKKSWSEAKIKEEIEAYNKKNEKEDKNSLFAASESPAPVEILDENHPMEVKDPIPEPVKAPAPAIQVEPQSASSTKANDDDEW